MGRAGQPACPIVLSPARSPSLRDQQPAPPDVTAESTDLITLLFLLIQSKEYRRGVLPPRAGIPPAAKSSDPT